MNIAVVGLGLIGGSLCKAIKKHTSHTVFGLDLDKKVIKKALDCGAIDKQIDVSELNTACMVFVCLFPEATIDFITNNIDNFEKGSIVADVCGVKKVIVDKVEMQLLDKGVFFVGTHPMAGREFSGFDFSESELFKGASFIITPTENTPIRAVEEIKKLGLVLGFGEIVITTAEIHDKNIAFTSQLAHIVSNAYIKSPTALNEHGFSAGSFQDLTRVAKLNEDMWSSLFMFNKENILNEIDTIIRNLEEYKVAIQKDDVNNLRKLLKEGSDIKEKTLK